MKSLNKRLYVAAALASFAIPLVVPHASLAQLPARPPKAASTGGASTIGVADDEAKEIAIEAYVYAYPLLIAELTRRAMLGAPPGAAMNQFQHREAFPDATFTAIVRPNADTLYSTLWFDVSKQPLVINVPDSGGRYYLLQMLDMWSDVFASPGSRTTGDKAQRIILASADWKGKTPAGATLIRTPTLMGFIAGRTQTNGVADYPNVHKFQAGLTANPLSKTAKNGASHGAIDPSWDVKTPPSDLIEKLSAKEYFELFAQLTKLNPPHANDYPIVHRMARIGLEVGKPFAMDAAPAVVQQALGGAAAAALPRIRRGLAGQGGAPPTGWRIKLSTIGTYGTDYGGRAQTAFAGFGANPPEDAIYPSALTDSDGKPLSSDKRYVIHFPGKQQLPPVRGFWSLTMYDERQLFAANALNRFAIGDRDELKFNADGSLDIYVQRTSPGPDRESNWLPAPARGLFTMNMRLYWPKSEALNGSWSPPPVKLVK